MSTSSLKYGVSEELFQDYKELQLKRRATKRLEYKSIGMANLRVYQGVVVSCNGLEELGTATITINQEAGWVSFIFNNGPAELAGNGQQIPFTAITRKERGVDVTEIHLHLLPTTPFAMFINGQLVRVVFWQFTFHNGNEAAAAYDAIVVAPQADGNVTLGYEEQSPGESSSNSDPDDDGRSKTTTKNHP